jgi:integrase
MAHLVRVWTYRYLDNEGHQVKKGTPGAKRVKVKAKKWYGASIPGYPPRKRVPLASNKTVAQTMLANLVRKGERGQAGMDDPAAEAQRVKLEQHLKDFRVSLEVKGTSPEQVNQVLQRVEDTFAACSFVYPTDLDGSKVEKYLEDRRCLPRKEGGLSIQTSNFYLGAVKQFVRWMLRKKKIAENPFLDVAPMNPKLDRRHDRRYLKTEELAKLLDLTRKSECDFRGLNGEDRYWLYHTVLSTGFRRNEVRALTPAQFELDASPPGVVLPTKRAKNKQGTVQVLPAGVAAGLREYLKGKPLDRPVWPGTWHEKPAKMLRQDLAAAGIPYVVPGPDGPLYADFHALRHTYITMLEDTGVSPKAAQELARHSDVRLTLGRYTHAKRQAMAEAVDRLALPANRDADPATDTLSRLSPDQVMAGFLLLGSVLRMLLGQVAVASVAHIVAHSFGPNGDDSGQTGTEGQGGKKRESCRKSKSA